MKYYVMSDIHGFFSATKKSLTEAGFYEDERSHKIIICGDLFDRGKEVFELQDFILDLMLKDEVILIKGNHEDLILEFIENIDRWLNRDVLFTHHWHNGTVQTVLKLVGMDLEQACKNKKVVVKKFKQSPFYKTIIPAMCNYYETLNYVFVHGWIPSWTCLDSLGRKAYIGFNQNWRTASEELWKEARWLNGMEAARNGIIEPNKVIVCGHFHCSYGWSHIKQERKEFPDKSRNGWQKSFEPYEDNGIIAIDACTVYSGIVNCIVLEDKKLEL